jgi:membrane-associated protease RseP (regulator of RpoE activity)
MGIIYVLNNIKGISMSFEFFLSIVIFCWLVVLWLDKQGKLPAERHAIILLFKTERGKGFIERVSRYKMFWKVFGSVGVFIGILGMLLVVAMLIFSLYSTYFLDRPIGGAMPVIPGVTIPFWYGIIGLITVLVVHEFAHGILARAENISIKSMGAILVTIIPIGAFVEPDEEELEAKERGPRMRVYAAGSFANILLAIFAALCIITFYGQFFNTSIVQVEGIEKCSPAYGILDEDMVLEVINGKAIKSARDYFEAVQEIEPNTDVTIKTDRGTFTIMALQNPNRPDSKNYTGIKPAHPLFPGLPEYIYSILYWVALLNQGIGLINLAPLHFGIAATDGHHILKDILSKLNFKNVEKATLTISTTVLIVVVFSLFAPDSATSWCLN